MTENDLFDKLQSQELEFPQQVRCAQCGQMATFEEFDRDPDDWVLGVYMCYTCSWWTEWEITPDETGGIGSSVLYFLSNDRVTSVSCHEACTWPGYWAPDGFTVPEEALRALEVVAQ